MGIYLGVNNISRTVPNIYVGKNDKARRVTKIYKGVNGKARQIYEQVDTREYAVKFSSDGDFSLGPSRNISLSNVNLEFSINEGLTQTRQRGDASSPIPLTGTSSQPIYLRGTGNTLLGSLNMPQLFTGKYIDGNLENLLDYQTVKAGGHPTMAEECFISMFQDCTTLERGADLHADVATEECCANLYKGCTNLLKIPTIDFLFSAPHGGILARSCCSEMFMNCSSLNGQKDITLTGFHIDSFQQSCFARMFKGCINFISSKPIYVHNSTELSSLCCNSMFEECTSLRVPSQILHIDNLNQTKFYADCITQMYKNCSALKVREITFTSSSPREIIRVPSSVASTNSSNVFLSTGGTFKGTPRSGYTYEYYT